MERFVLAPSSKIAFLAEKIRELGTSPAWSGQVDLLPSSLEEGEGRATILVKNRFVRDWVRENFLPTLQQELSRLDGPELSIQLSIAPTAHNEAVAVTPAISPRPELKAPAALSSPPAQHDSLKDKYSFEHFVVGSSNQFAHAAARAVAKTPGRNYNPLFLYGGVGLGKTHLLNAIGLEILKNNPGARILYLASEKFMNEVIYCMRFDKMGELRKKYRDNCDVLLIDDIQFIAGKERTQDEFFHTFNHHYDLQRQIVLTSDKSPREIPDLEERLRSRFEWGLLADIQVPDLETRIAILKKKSDEDGITLEDGLALFLATHIKSNVRELEGSLIRLNAFASLNNVPLSIVLAKDVLKNVLSGVDRILTVEQIQKAVADFYRIKLSDLIGKRRIKSLALPRQIAMYLCRKHVKSSYPEIGQKFGGKDHSTVVHAFNKIGRDIIADSTLREHVESLEQNING
ncbi:MAG TPA: chromosomal replication initiator protein DnaA [bacterium]|nr:chromosomal replication initiator protein DnaA [bacterium]